MIDIEEIAKTISNIKRNENALDILLMFDGIIDGFHIYAYENWLKGEVVKGPITQKYWVEVHLMYPMSNMPDPAGARRLTKYGCHVFYREDELKSTVKLKSQSDLVPSDSKPGHFKPKNKVTPVCIVKISMPRHLFDDYSMLKMDALNQDMDLDDLIAAYDDGLDVERGMGE